MSSERNEPGTGAAWQGNQLQWDDTYEEVSTFSANAGETPDQISTPAALEAISKFGLPRRAQQRILDEPEVGATPWQVFLHLGRQALPFLIPLLLAGLTFLCILPLSLHHHAYVDGSHLWPLILLILALAALQGMILFYTDTNEGLWSLAVTGGFALFVVIAAFALIGPMIALLLLILFTAAAFLAIRFYLHKVSEGYVDVTYAFGKYNRTLLPGLNFRLPWEKEIRHLQTREVVWTCDEQTLLFSREDDLHLKATISYQLLPEDAHLVAEQVDDWEEKLHKLLVETLQNVASHLTPDDVLIWSQPVGAFNGLAGNDEMTRREQLNNRLAQQLRDKVALWGVQLNWAQVRDVSLTPRLSSFTFDRDSAARIPAENGSDTIVRGRKAVVDENATERMADPLLNTERPAQPVPAAAPTPSFSTPVSTPATPIKIPKVETLRQLYDEVRNERITSPTVIRDYAARFEAFACLPDADKSNLDAGLAAQFLRERADMIERQESKKALAGSVSRPPDPLSRLPKDENLTAGG
jgi:regulator of protease activity HflC (stomatin/prohibitin superfamily)